MSDPGEEEEIVSRKVAEDTALKVRGSPDPFKDIPPSLLSAEHIQRYVEGTGLIGPFFKGGKKSRLKKASYEGRIGKVAFEYKDGQLVRYEITDGIRVAANSIVFVECDLDFRLPEYIALRFNLQITHVHRGLLLGTGPLVDPGFWGKLCIPLHNLTSEDYFIPHKEGLIWVEFTKTTSSLEQEASASGRKPSNSGYWDIREFILKAANNNGTASAVPIQSSIRKGFTDAIAAAAEAEKSAKHSELLAKQAKQNSFRLTVTGVVGAIVSFVAVAIGMAQLVDGQKSFILGQTAMYKDYINSTKSTVTDLNSALEKWQADTKALRSEMLQLADGNIERTNLRSQLQEIEAENERLKAEIIRLTKKM